MSRVVRLTIQNATGRQRTLCLEPWARHFLMTPDEKVEVVARGTSDVPELRLVEAGEATLLYTTGCDRVRVIQGEVHHDLLPVYADHVAPGRPERRDDDPMWDRELDGIA